MPSTPPLRLDAFPLVAAMLAAIDDPARRIRAIRAVRAELQDHDRRLDDLSREAILELRAADPPATWAQIGELLDVSAQRAYQLAADKIQANTSRRTT